MNQEDEAESPQQQQNQPLPDYIEIEGKKVFVGGLDFEAIKQERRKIKQSKKGLLSQLQGKINVISGQVLERVQKKEEEAEKQLDEISIKIMKEDQPKNQKKKVSIFYQFDLNTEGFGKKTPQIIIKRMGKSYNKPVFIEHDTKFIEQFGRLLLMKNDEGQPEEKKNQFFMADQDEQDDIFNVDNEQKINIEIGKKLQFGIDEDILVTAKREQPVERQEVEEDKYFFMRKKKAKMQDYNDDGYGECYNETGPSLKEMKELKKEGIQLFGDAKQFKGKERKGPNIQKELDMVQKIIEKKYKK